jgi:hypothetical protein
VGPSGVAWANPTQITADDGSFATTTIGTGAGTKSKSLEATNFGFAIPGGSAIVGIVVEWKFKQSPPIGTGVFDDTVQLIKSGAVIPLSADKGTHVAFPTIVGFRTYGSSSDTWSVSLTVSDVNDATFGSALAASNNDGDSTASVDFCRITVYYGTPQDKTPPSIMVRQAFDLRMFIE